MDGGRQAFEASALPRVVHVEQGPPVAGDVPNEFAVLRLSPEQAKHGAQVAECAPVLYARRALDAYSAALEPNVDYQASHGVGRYWHNAIMAISREPPRFASRMTDAQFRRALKALRLTRRALAERLRVNVRTVYRWASGESAVPEVVALLLVCWQEKD